MLAILPPAPNVAVAVAKLGATSAFIGKVGEDPFGRRLEGVLKGYGVDTRGMRFDPVHRTTLNFMTLPEPNRTEMLFYRNPGADMLLSPDELDDGLIGSASVYQFGSVSLAVEPCRTAALEGGRVRAEPRSRRDPRCATGARAGGRRGAAQSGCSAWPRRWRARR